MLRPIPMAPKTLPKTDPKKKPKPSSAKRPTGKETDPRPERQTVARKSATSAPRGTAPAKGAGTRARQAPVFVPRALVNADEDDELMAHGGGGAGYGRCGGRLLSSRLEQHLCNWLGRAGIVHSHSPRHYEIRYEEGRVAAYAPQIVLRGRGREGKSVVIEAVEDLDSPILRKIIAFRSQYGQEFYLIVVAADEVLDDVPLAAFDESCSTTNVNTLIARLAE
jgi:hypothetical protein